MNERDARVVSFIRALEGVDRERRVLTSEKRAEASAFAQEETVVPSAEGDPSAGNSAAQERFILSRGKFLFRDLESRWPFLGSGRVLHDREGILLTGICVVALGIGLGSNVLGQESRISILAFPLVALLAWNLAVYLLLMIGFVARLRGRPKGAKGSSARGFSSSIAGVFAWLATWLQNRFARLATRIHVASDPAGVILGKAIVQFINDWRQKTAALVLSRARHAVHLASIALTLGVVLGMYARGLAFRYEATWDSTFVSADVLQGALETILAPATTLLGERLPDVASLRHPQAGPAALWIHLWTVTAALFILIPRSILALWERHRAMRLAGAIPLDLEEPYFRRILAPQRGEGVAVDIIPYALSLDGLARDALHSLFYDCFGARARIQVRETMAWGDQVPGEPGQGTDEVLHEGQADQGGAAPANAANPLGDRFGPHDGCKVLLFGLAQSPEPDVHVEFLRAVQARADAEGSVLVVVDGSAFRRAGYGEDRGNERRRAWNRLLEGAGIQPVHLDLGRPIGDEVLAKIPAALWRPARLDGVVE